MQIKQLTLGEFETNCYLIQGPDEKHCVIVDPADQGEEIFSILQEMNTKPDAVFLTHSHFDHILGVPYLQKRWPQLPVYCHKLDWTSEQTEVYFGKTYPTVAAFSNLYPYEEGDEISAAGLSIKVIHTPGHTPGSVTLMIESVLFTGDTLFCQEIGRTDFDGGNEEEMMCSLAKLAALRDDYKVLSGHGVETTLNAERIHNPYLKKAQMRWGKTDQPFETR